MKRVSIEFLRNSTPYRRGEVAGFEEERAKHFVKKGFARYWKDPAVVAAEAAAALEAAKAGEADADEDEGAGEGAEGGESGTEGGDDGEAEPKAAKPRRKRVKA